MVQDPTSKAKVAPPVLDLAPFFENESGHGVLERRRAVLEEMSNAAQEWGLFQVINHGLDSSLLREALENVKNFFALPLEEKVKLRTDDCLIGFGHDTLIGVGEMWSADKKEQLYFTVEDHPLSVRNAWPETLTNFRSQTEELARQAQKTAEFLLSIMSQSLGLSKRALKSAFKSCDRYLLVKYPAAMTEDGVTLPKHQDANCFTLIAQLNQVEGYQLLKDGESETWVTVQPVKDALLVNIADVLQVLTNGKFKSVVHRVVSNKKERFCFIYSLCPAMEEEIAPVPQFTVEVNEPARYRPFKYEELFALKLAKNIAVDHFLAI